MKYKKCEICGLNYVKNGNICDICLEEKKQSLQKRRVLCPFCYERLMDADDVMCNACAKSNYFSENYD